MKLDEIRAAEARLLLSTYDRSPVLFVGGEGVHIIDERGDRYLDLLSGIGVNALGYNHPAIVDAIALAEPVAHPHVEPLLSRGAGGACPASHRAYGTGSRLLRQHRYGSLGGRAQAGARLRRTQAQRGREHRLEVSCAGAELPRPHLRLHGHHLQGQVSRSVRARHAGC